MEGFYLIGAQRGYMLRKYPFFGAAFFIRLFKIATIIGGINSEDDL